MNFVLTLIHGILLKLKAKFKVQVKDLVIKWIYIKSNIFYDRKIIIFGGVKINLVNKKEEYEFLGDLNIFNTVNKTWEVEKFEGPAP